MEETPAVDGSFDFDAPADLFPGGDRTHRVGYRRFKNLAAAVAYCLERLTPMQMHGAVIETDEDRYELAEIRALYDRVDFPLLHREPEAAPRPHAARGH